MAFDLNLQLTSSVLDARYKKKPARVLNPLAGTALFNATLHTTDTLTVPEGTVIEGDFQARCVYIKGTVRGKVTATAGPLVIERTGAVWGQVCGAGDVVIAGRVSGHPDALAAVQVTGCLHLASTARVKGNVRYADIRIYRGAVVEGVLVGV
jgi:cytoskeletal protein CcmA (bactofilin family)